MPNRDFARGLILQWQDITPQGRFSPKSGLAARPCLQRQGQMNGHRRGVTTPEQNPAYRPSAFSSRSLAHRSKTTHSALRVYAVLSEFGHACLSDSSLHGWATLLRNRNRHRLNIPLGRINRRARAAHMPGGMRG